MEYHSNLKHLTRYFISKSVNSRDNIRINSIFAQVCVEKILILLALSAYLPHEDNHAVCLGKYNQPSGMQYHFILEFPHVPVPSFLITCCESSNNFYSQISPHKVFNIYHISHAWNLNITKDDLPVDTPEICTFSESSARAPFPKIKHNG